MNCLYLPLSSLCLLLELLLPAGGALLQVPLILHLEKVKGQAEQGSAPELRRGRSKSTDFFLKSVFSVHPNSFHVGSEGEHPSQCVLRLIKLLQQLPVVLPGCELSLLQLP